MAFTTPLPRIVLSLLAILWLASTHWATRVHAIAIQGRDETSWSIDSAEDPVLQKLFVQNKAWAAEVEKEHPGFFNHSAEGQHPNVRVDISVNE